MCNCGGSKAKLLTKERQAAAAASPKTRGPLAPGYAYSGPEKRAAAKQK